MQKYLRWNRWWQEGFTFLTCVVLAVIVLSLLVPPLQTLAAVTPNGILVYSDNTTSSTKYRTWTNSTNTLGAETADGLALATDADHEVLRRAPTRQEMMVGQLHDDGKIVTRTFNGSTWTTRQNIAGLVAAANTDRRAFDIAYEGMKGRALWVYADDPTTGKLYYCLWDGTAWTPVSNCAPTNGTNDIDLTDGTNTLTGVPRKVKLAPGRDGTDFIWLMVEDANSDLYVIRWNGTSWDTATDITASTNLSCNDSALTLRGMCFDLGVESLTGTPYLFYVDGTTALDYRSFDNGTNTWSSPTLGFTLASAGNWLRIEEDPASDRLALVSGASGADFRPLVWKTDGTTPGLTTGNNDTAVEAMNGQNVDVAWEKGTGLTTRTAVWVFTDANALIPSYETATCDGTGCTFSTPAILLTAATDCLDDCDRLLLTSNPHGDDMLLAVGDIDSELSIYEWSGSVWARIATRMTTAGLLVDGTANTNHVMFPFWFEFWKYGPWSRNWQFFSGTDTASSPTVTLAAQNTPPTSFATSGSAFRLRINYAERGSQTSTDSRKKLQYTSGCTPNVAGGEESCVWTDVDNAAGAGIWRYLPDASLACTPTDCDDNVLLTATKLTGSGACSLGNGCSTWVLSKDGATVTNMDHNGLQVQEGEWIVESNGATAATTYYFRIYDVGNDFALWREQDSSDCGTGGTDACTYPSITTAAPGGPTVEDVMRHGNWFSSGLEQSFFWAD